MKGSEELVAAAAVEIATLSVEEVARQMNDAGAVFVDVRCENELWRTGLLTGAVNVPRGMLEFAIDPASPYHNPIFRENVIFIFYCASGTRSALAARQAQEMGLARVAHLGGGLKAWKAAGYALAPFRKPWTFEEMPKEEMS